MWSELGLRGVVIFVDYSSDDGFSADGSQVGHVPDGMRFDVRGPLSPGLVRPVTVVVDQEAYAKVSLKKYKPMAARNEDRNVSSGLL
jgi:hypothetical protein